MATDNNKTKVHDLFKAIDAAQNMTPFDALTAAGYVAHFPGMPAMDRAGIAAFGNGFFAACPGLRHDVEAVIAEGDIVAVRMTIHGVHSQPFAMPTGTLPPSGRSFAMPVHNMFRFAEGRIVEQWAVFDMLGFLQQLGAIPS